MADERSGLLQAEEDGDGWDEGPSKSIDVKVTNGVGTHTKGKRAHPSERYSTNPLLVPVLVRLLEFTGIFTYLPKRLCFKVTVYFLTFIAYASYHLNRKPFSVVKVVLHPEHKSPGDGWPPFNDNHGKILLGSVDYSWLFAYAIAMFFSGQIADRVNLRYFLTLGMLGSAISTMLLGVAYYANIHHISYFIGIQVFGGIMQSTGWPSVVSIMGHWFGIQRRGLIMGIWNAHTSVGNILGTIIPSFWANPTSSDPNPPWGLSFVVPSLIMGGVAMLVFFLLVVDPQYVGLKPPVHTLEVAEEKDDVSDDNSSQTSEADMEGDDGKVIINVRPSSRPSVPESLPVGFLRALMIPGVVEYSLALFFNKLVSYTFLFWLPFYVSISHPHLSRKESDWLSTLFDVGGIIGGILTGVLSDVLNARALSCIISLVLAVPSLFFLRFFGNNELWLFMVLLVVCGAFINGPYGIITTAVSSDLGTHPSLNNNQNAKATVTAIIDGTGSLGAALGPLLIGWLTDSLSWDAAFYALMVSCFLSAVLLGRLFVTEVIALHRKIHGLYLKWTR